MQKTWLHLKDVCDSKVCEQEEIILDMSDLYFKGFEELAKRRTPIKVWN